MLTHWHVYLYLYGKEWICTHTHRSLHTNTYSHTNEKEILLALPQIKNSLSSQSTKIVIWPNLLNNKSHQFLKLEAKCWNFANLYKQNDNCFKTRTQSFIFHILKAVIGQSKKLKAVKQQIWTIFLKKLK